jgi:hypothetical protein
MARKQLFLILRVWAAIIKKALISRLKGEWRYKGKIKSKSLTFFHPPANPGCYPLEYWIE